MGCFCLEMEPVLVFLDLKWLRTSGFLLNAHKKVLKYYIQSHEPHF